MKIAHLSDLHYCAKHLKWVDKAMADAVNRAIEEGCDVAVISGDSFDHALGAHEPAFRAWLAQMLRLAANMSVLALQGTLSHDKLGMINTLSSLPTKYPILVADETSAYSLSKVPGGFVWKEGAPEQSTTAVFCTLPSLNKADPAIMELGPAVYARSVMAGFSDVAQRARALKIPSILVTHGMIVGSITESRHAMTSPDHEFTEQMLFSSGCDAIMIGHVHAGQEWREGTQIIAYPGSLARLIFGDSTLKRWLLWSVQSGIVYYDEIPTVTRNLLEIEFDEEPDIEDLEALASETREDDAVRVRWVVTQERAALIDKDAIRQMFKHCDQIKIEDQVIPVQSTRAAGMAKAKTLASQITYWADTINRAADTQDLIDRADLLVSHDIEEVVKIKEKG